MSWKTEDADRPGSVAAPLDPRIKAGAVDLLALTLLVALYFSVPLLLGGLTLPMWGVFAAVLGYSVVPLVAFRATAGMRLFGLELVGKDGHAGQIIDVVFRELIGRGFFPFAYLSTLAAGVVATYLGLFQFAQPAGLGKVLFHISWILLAATSLGHFLVFTRPDRRSLADLLSRTVVRNRVLRPLPSDPEERLEEVRARRGRLRTLIIAELVLVGAGVGLPYALTRQTPGENRGQYAERLVREKLQRQFDRDQGNRLLAAELRNAYLAAGQWEEAEAVRGRHQEALSRAGLAREQALRERVKKDPKDEGGLDLLLELLQSQGRREDAVAAYREALEGADSPLRREGFGIWLHELGLNALADVELTLAIEGDPELADAFAYRGLTRVELGRHQEARADLEAALALEPDLEEVEDALVRLDASGLAVEAP